MRRRPAGDLDPHVGWNLHPPGSSLGSMRWVHSSVIIVLFALAAGSPASARVASMEPAQLRCEYAENPMGVESPRPQLSWVLLSKDHDQRQSAYRILVSSSAKRLQEGRVDLWDSGIVRTGESAHITYEGAPLASGMQCHWKVRIWDDTGTASRWSDAGQWEMGLLRAEDWTADWIGAGPAREPRPPHGFFRSTNELTSVTGSVQVNPRSVLLRKEVELRQGIRRARAFVTGLGYYELHCNGRRVGDRVLAPAKSNYRKWVLYDTCDLTPFLEPGTNALGLILGNGWFNPAMKWWEPYRMQWFGSPRARLQIHVEYDDGSTSTIGTDGTWKTKPGPILSACVYDGEEYDATQESPGWDKRGHSERDWRTATVVEAPGGALVSHLMPAIRVTQHLRPVGIRTPRPGVHVFDLGQNFAGWVRLRVSGPRGTRVTMRYAEDVHPDGTLDTGSNERALATDVYVLKGEGRETYEPRFTFHGFRYVEITGYPGTPALGDVLGCVVHTACARTGSFASDHGLINRIHEATVWSQRSCMMGYPIDCPQRDERLGWMGDALVTAEEALYNFDVALFQRQWLEGIRFNQNPADGDISIVSPRPYTAEEPDPVWSSAYPVMVWEFFRHHGDRRFLGEHFDALSRYVDHLGTQATNHVLPRYWIGDWGSIVEGWKEGDPPSVTTAFYFLDATIAGKAARVLERTNEAARYESLSREIRSAFRQAYLHPGGQHFEPETQFGNALPLVLGLAEETERPAVLDNILADLERHGGHFDVGVLGAKYLVDALTDSGRPDAAFALATQTGYPSWAHMLEGGRNTLSEFWDLHGSHNHVMMGSIDAWFYRVLAGIQPDEARPGFRHIVIRPFVPDSVGRVEARVETVRGRIAVGWWKQRKEWVMRVDLPANTEATVFVPAGPSARVRCTPARAAERREPGVAVYSLGSGRYEFRVSTNQ